MHGVPHQVTLEAIPLDMLCVIWEVFDHVEHLTCERVSDPQQVCLMQFRMLCVVHYLVVTFQCLQVSLKQQQLKYILFHHYAFRVSPSETCLYSYLNLNTSLTISLHYRL